jgi:uncharacterized OsmC-like protein
MNPADIKDLFDRKARAMTKRPAFARGSGQASTSVGDALACDVDVGGRSIRVDLPAEDGGTGSAAHPGQLMRASVSACLALGYKLWAARLQVPIDAVSVELTCAYDARGQLGLDPSVAVGWQRMIIEVAIVSGAPEADVRRMVETADRLSPMLANLAPHIERVHRLSITPPQAHAAVAR